MAVVDACLFRAIPEGSSSLGDLLVSRAGRPQTSRLSLLPEDTIHPLAASSSSNSFSGSLNSVVAARFGFASCVLYFAWSCGLWCVWSALLHLCSRPWIGILGIEGASGLLRGCHRRAASWRSATTVVSIDGSSDVTSGALLMRTPRSLGECRVSSAPTSILGWGLAFDTRSVITESWDWRDSTGNETVLLNLGAGGSSPLEKGMLVTEAPAHC